MKGRKQKISDQRETLPQKDRTASEGNVEGQTFMWITENNLTTNDYRSGNGLLEQILSPSNLNAAFKQVRSNKGAGGADKMELESLKDYLDTNKDMLIKSIQMGRYRPNPLAGCAYPKKTENKVSWASPRLLTE